MPAHTCNATKTAIQVDAKEYAHTSMTKAGRVDERA